jgi:hypothetical protein
MLPNEPEILLARRAFPDAQAALTGVVAAERNTRNTLGWYGTTFHEERGSFAIVREDGPLADLVGDRLRLRYGKATPVFVYCIGAREIADGYDIVVPRRVFAALELLAVDRIDVIVEVLA